MRRIDEGKMRQGLRKIPKQAFLPRVIIPEHKRRPTFLIVDEAAAYFDSNAGLLVSRLREAQHIGRKNKPACARRSL